MPAAGVNGAAMPVTRPGLSEAMRMLGLIGGMSWESTAIYYRHLNELARERLGGLHSARLLLWSFDFAEIAELQHRGDWAAAGELLADAARRLEAAGAEALVLCTNTMHKLADTIQAAVGIPLLHIADATGAAIAAAGCRRPALLATRFTMEQPFYARPPARTGTRWSRSSPTRRGGRWCTGSSTRNSAAASSAPNSKATLPRARSTGCAMRGADGVILGCTEITMLISPGRSRPAGVRHHPAARRGRHGLRARRRR